MAADANHIAIGCSQHCVCQRLPADARHPRCCVRSSALHRNVSLCQSLYTLQQPWCGATAVALQVSFGDLDMVTPGQQLSINDIANEPKVEITNFKPTGVYSFLLVRVCAVSLRGLRAHASLCSGGVGAALQVEHDSCGSCQLVHAGGGGEGVAGGACHGRGASSSGLEQLWLVAVRDP